VHLFLDLMKNMFGAHLPTSDGLEELYSYAERLDINHVQIFTASNRQLSLEYVINDKKLQVYFELKKQYPHISFYSHAGYLINLASDDNELRERSMLALQAELKRCEQLEILSTVIHPGSNKNKEKGLGNICKSLKEIHENNTSNVIILLEPSAGQGSTMPCNLKELEFIYKEMKLYNNIGLCIDTCHAHASGYDMSNKNTMYSYFESIDEIWSINRIKLIHINDSMKPCSANIDRHANIGKGDIGEEGFKEILNYELLKNIPKILETPYEKVMDYEKDLDIMRKLIA
jgi:deoxyribonuclease-4